MTKVLCASLKRIKNLKKKQVRKEGVTNCQDGKVNTVLKAHVKTC